MANLRRNRRGRGKGKTQYGEEIVRLSHKCGGSKVFRLCARHHSHGPEVNSNVGLLRSGAEGKPHSGKLRVHKISPYVEIGGVFFYPTREKRRGDVSSPEGEDGSIPSRGKGGARFSVVLKGKKNTWAKK